MAFRSYWTVFIACLWLFLFQLKTFHSKKQNKELKKKPDKWLTKVFPYIGLFHTMFLNPDSELFCHTRESQQDHFPQCCPSLHACHLRSSQLGSHTPQTTHLSTFLWDDVPDLSTAGFNPEQGSQGTSSHAFLPLLLLLLYIPPKMEGEDSFFLSERNSQCIPDSS